MFQVPRVVKFEAVRKKGRKFFFGLLAVRKDLVKRAVEWAVKKPLGRLQKAVYYPRSLG